MRRWQSLISILLLAFALRVYRLDHRALWWDEGLSLLFAKLSFRENAAMAVRLADTNPPFYRLLLGGWTALGGSSAFSSRLFSAAAGMVTVAAAYAVGRRLAGGRPQGGRPQEPALNKVKGSPLRAMLFAAASPMLVYYSQEAKAYSLVAAGGLLSILFWLVLHRSFFDNRTGRGVRRETWVVSAPSVVDFAATFGYFIVLSLALGAHYIAAFLAAVEGLWSLGLSVSHLRRGHPLRSILAQWAGMVAAWMAVAAVLLPFIGLTYGQTSAAVRGLTGEFTGLSGPVEFLAQHALEFVAGPGTGGAAEWIAVGIVMALVAIETMWKSAKADWLPAAFLWSWLLLPLLAGLALNTYHEFFFPRFLLFCLPALLILAAEGAARLSRRWRWAGAAVTAVLLALWAAPLARHYADAGDPAEDWRPIGAALRPYVRQGDAAIYGWGWMPGYLHAYLPPGVEPEYYLGFYSPETLEPELSAITAGHSRAWLMDYRIDALNPYNAAGQWLAARGALAYSERFGNAHVALFLPGEHLPAPGPDARAAQFENGLTVRWSPVNIESAPGDSVGIALEWQAAVPVTRRYTAFLHGLAPDGRLAFGRDSEPVNGLRPTEAFRPGERVRDWRGLLLPPDLPPGEYALEAGLYDTVTGEVATTLEREGSVVIGKVTVR